VMKPRRVGGCIAGVIVCDLQAHLIRSKVSLGLTVLIESTPSKEAATHFGVENHFACFPRVGEAPTLML
jgi:hypothetical protein